MKLTGPQATIIAAIIAVFGIAVGSFLSPLAEKVINKPTPTLNPTSLAVEEIPFWISTYDGEGDSDPACCAGRGVLEYGNNVSHFPEYILTYIPSGDGSKYSYAGIDFVFKPSQNLFDYKNIEFTLTFSNKVSQAEFKFEDIAKTIESFRLVGSVDSEKSYVIPFENFTTVDFKAIRAISFQVDSAFASGRSNITVKNIRFIK